MPHGKRLHLWLTTLLPALVALAGLHAQPQRGRGTESGEWRHYAGDVHSTKYSPLGQINAGNVRNLRIAWRREALDDGIKAKYPAARTGNNFQSTPLMVGGTLYATIGLRMAAAMDPATGRTLWVYDPPKAGEQPSGGAGRGLAYWSDGNDRRIVHVAGEHLVALDARTGRPIPTFGDNGRVDLKVGLSKPVERYGWSSPPLVARDVIVVGSGVSDIGSAEGRSRKEMPPGDVRGYDARTGRQLWLFKTIPPAGEFGNDTWEDGSWEYTGNTNVWSWMSADEELGYVYLPLTTPDDRR